MQDYSIVDYDRLEKEMRGIKDARTVWQRLLSLPKLILGAVLVCFYLFISSLAFCLVLHHITGETPSVFGHQMYIAGDDSMNQAFPSGSLLFVRPVDPPDIVVGDAIAFRGTSVGQTLIAHRVVGVHKGEGALWFTTRGDGNEADDPVPVAEQNLLGSVRYSVPFIGRIIDFAGMGTGPLVMIVFPLVLLIVFELRSLFKMSAGVKKRKEGILPGGTQILLKGPGPEENLPLGTLIPPAKAKVKVKTLGKINGRPAARLANIKNINYRERSNNGPGHNGQCATIITFARKATATTVPGKDLEGQAGDTPSRYFRSKQKAETLGRRKRYPNYRTRAYVRSAYRYIVKSTEKYPT